MKMIGAIILPQPFLDKIFPNNFTTKGSEASTHGQIKSWWPDNNEILTGQKDFQKYLPKIHRWTLQENGLFPSAALISVDFLKGQRKKCYFHRLEWAYGRYSNFHRL
jgi:hypothetical protein